MGTINFQLPAGLPADAAHELERACIAGGPDTMPYRTQVRVDPGLLVLERPVDESGCLVVPWTVQGAGRLMGSSATLIERPEPYQIQVELSRGKVNQLRCQASDWLAGGLQMPPSLMQQIHDATITFTRAVVQTASDQAGQQAQNALTLAYKAADQLVRVYMDQVFHIRHQRQPRLDSALGCRLGVAAPAGEVGDTLALGCNTVYLPFNWREIEPAEADYRWEAHDALLAWAQAQNLAVNAGPLIDFSAGRLPDWLWLWERDLRSLASFMCDYVETTVKRYRGKVRSWQLTAASNFASVLQLGEDELLWLTVRLAEAARQADPGLELVIGIAQPWGGYLARQERNHSPFIFADTLIRSGLNLAALDLEVVMGISPRGSYCRDLLDMSRLLDLYALLGVPLQLTLGYPSAEDTDANADGELDIAAGRWRGGMTPDVQADWLSLYGALALCKPYVHGVYWAHYSDAERHQFPHCGLLDGAGNPKPALFRLRELRDRHVR
jgi:hypothetical protein